MGRASLALLIAVFILFVPVFAPIESPALANPILSLSDEEALRKIVDEDIQYVQEGISFIKDDKDAPWGALDAEFYGLWLSGLESERRGDFADAAKAYGLASKVDRGEIPSYEALLPLGRARLRNNETDKARSALDEYLRCADDELTDSGPWALGSEGERTLTENMRRARWLLDIIGEGRVEGQ